MPKPKKKVAPPTPIGNRATRRLMEKSAKVNREFSYSLPGVNLSFTLRIDNDKELTPFLECLKEAVKDVEAQIASVQK